MRVWVNQFFHPIGHGTFHTGLAWSLPGEYSFSWAYDCGSKRKSKTEAAISALTSSPFNNGWTREEQIDLLVLSHFDNDHVNGVETFLRTWAVKWLALPYTDLPQRLAQAAGLTTDRCSDSTALLQLSPLTWLRYRRLNEQVESILVVDGRRPPETNNTSDRPLDDLPDSWPQNHSGPEDYYVDRIERKRRLANGGATDLGEKTTGHPGASNQMGSGPKLATLHHSQAFNAIGGNVEFMFYNSHQPSLCSTTSTGVHTARRSGATMAAIDAEVQDVVRRYNIGVPRGRPRPLWKKALRDIYDHHFGSSSHARNNISLCLMTRTIMPCKAKCIPCLRRYSHPKKSAGSLLLGDLKIDGAIIASMQEHFGAVRWNDLEVVQVPHHGSQHSWEPGIASMFDAGLFIHCIPTVSPHHPHPTVTADLAPHYVLKANYHKGVQVNFKTRPGHLELSCWNDDLFKPTFP